MARTFGADLVQRISEGSLAQIPSEYLAKIRDEVSQAIEELIDVGARVRPLLADGKQIGWVRGVHLSERKALKRWIYDEVDFAEHLLRIGTTLSPERISELSPVDLRLPGLTTDSVSDSAVHRNERSFQQISKASGQEISACRVFPNIGTSAVGISNLSKVSALPRPGAYLEPHTTEAHNF